MTDIVMVCRLVVAIALVGCGATLMVLVIHAGEPMAPPTVAEAGR